MKRRDFRFIMRTALLAFLMLFITLATVTSMRTGIGFGRDLRVILTTKHTDKLDAFLGEQAKWNREYQKQLIRDNNYVITISGVESADDFKKSLEVAVDDVAVIHIGTFGSNTKLLNNQSFIGIYLVALVFVVFAYFGYRYRFHGIVSAFQISIALMIALLVLFTMNNPFTKTLWYTMNLAFIISTLQKQVFLSSSLGTPVDEMSQPQWYLRHHLLSLSAYLVLGIMMIGLLDYNYAVNGWFLILFGVLLFLQDVYMVRYGYRYIKTYNHGFESATELHEENFFGKPHKPKRTFMNIIIVLLGGIIISGVFSVRSEPRINQGRDFASHNVLMIPYPTSGAYLEIQAILNSIGMFDAQIDYSVSDQGYIWIEFDERVGGADLRAAMEIIQERMGVDSSYYFTSSKTFPLNHIEFYVAYAALSVIVLLLLRLSFRSADLVGIGVGSVISLGAFILLTFIFDIVWEREIIFMVWSIPFIYGTAFCAQKRLDDLANPQHFALDSIRGFVMSSSIFVIIAATILIVVPIQMGITLVTNYLMLFVAFHLGILGYYLLYIIFRKVVSNHDDGTS